MKLDEANVDSLWVNINELNKRVRYLEKLIDTRDSVWYKRIWWRIQGYPPWYRVGTKKRF